MFARRTLSQRFATWRHRSPWPSARRGNVASPLRYAWRPGMRVSDLIPEREALIALLDQISGQ